MTETREARTERETALANLPTPERIARGDIRITLSPDLLVKVRELFPDMAIFRQSDRSAYPTAQAKPIDRVTKLLYAHIITAKQARACMRYRHCRDVFMANFTAKAIDTSRERVDGGSCYDDGTYDKTVIDCYRAILRHVPLDSLRWLEEVVAKDAALKEARRIIGVRNGTETNHLLRAIDELEYALQSHDA